MKYYYFLLVLLLFTCCAAASYTYYGVAPDSQGKLVGTLLGKEPKDDLPLSRCAPDDQEKGKCVVLFRNEYERILIDIADLKAQLRACEEK